MEEESKLMNKWIKCFIGLIFLGIPIGYIVYILLYYFIPYLWNILLIWDTIEYGNDYTHLFFDMEHLAQFGDSFGLFTSIFTLIGIGLLFYSILIQREELKNMVKEAKTQRFDDKFFQMIGLLNDIVDKLEIEISKKIYSKKDVFEQLLKEMRIRGVYKNDETEVIKFWKKYFSEYSAFEDDRDTTLKYFFINFYQILKYIDDEKNINNIGNDEKQAYAKILKAQLTKDMLILLCYHAIGIIHHSGDNYKTLIERYGMLRHLSPQHLDKNEDTNKDTDKLILFCYKEEAFVENEGLEETITNIEIPNKEKYKKELLRRIKEKDFDFN